MQINKSSGQVEIIGPDGRVYLYTYHTAHTLVSEVYDALSQQKRWDDPDYLSKMVFCRMIPLECWKEETGFGIGTQLYADVNLLVTLDTVKQTITIQSASNLHDKFHMSFSEFIDSYVNNAAL
jgi:hypothetical protein